MPISAAIIRLTSAFVFAWFASPLSPLSVFFFHFVWLLGV